MLPIINCTAHPINFLDPSLPEGVRVVAPSGVIINAKIDEGVVGEREGITFVQPTFVADPKSAAALDALERENPGAVIVGSVVAAQAYPGRVAAMVPALGFERMPNPADKRMRLDKFTLYGPPCPAGK